MNAKILLIIGIVLFLSSSVIAIEYKLLCLKQGEVLKYSLCNPNLDDSTCGGTTCQRCVKVLDNGAPCPGGNTCNHLGLKCSSLVNATLDKNAPTINVTAPLNGGNYSSKSILINIALNEESRISYIDNSKGREIRLCSSCKSYIRKKTFKEGWNNITFKAVDKNTNEATENVRFLIDTKKPWIKKILPKTRSNLNGEFVVVYDEENIQQIKMKYGNDVLGYTTYIKLDCPSGKSQTCYFNVDLTSYAGQKVYYSFEVTDVVGHIKTSRNQYGFA